METDEPGRTNSEPEEIYSPQRKAELLLNNAVNAADYERAVREVRNLGLDPAKIKHQRP